ncbi:MAG: Coenzyme F420 hydrogenase/dehydrogenase, beta subunit C-terminal domain [Promethearchaeota archaeon]|jgi:coenzyme F420 hydrogenase subunit beta
MGIKNNEKESDDKKQIIDFLQSNFLGMGFKELQDHVIYRENCVLCGCCTTLCPRIGLNEQEPALIDYDPECSTCFRYCPQTYYPEELFEKELFHENIKKSYPLGFYQELLTAKSTDEQILKVAQNGGVVSTLLIHALETGLIDGVLLIDRDEKWVPQPFIARTKEEILACAGSKYTVAPSLSIYKDAINEYKLEKLAFVGMPCQIQAVRKLQLYSPLSTEYGKFTLIIGLFCFSNYSYDLMKEFVQEDLEAPLNTINKIDVSKGKFYAYMNDGTIKTAPIKETKKFNWVSCQHCNDYCAEGADISVGSVGTIENGWNSVIVRTDVGQKLFNAAVKAKEIVTSTEINLQKLEKEALRKKTRITQFDEKSLNAMKILNASEMETKVYTTLMSLGNVNEKILSNVIKVEKEVVQDALDSLIQRNWVVKNHKSYSCIDPTLVINNEIHKLKINLSEKIEKLKCEALPNLETIYAQNNHVRMDEKSE